MGDSTVEQIRTQRDSLLERLHSVYSGAPSTNFQAYRKAQTALKKYEDLTFSDEEIDAFLPKELKKSQKLTSSENIKSESNVVAIHE